MVEKICPVRVLVVGAGDRGENYSRSLRHLDYVAVTGIADPRVVRRRKIKQKCVNDWFPSYLASEDHVKEYGDWTEALGDADEYDCVLVCVLDQLHRDVAVAFADKGKHILCEKPLATSLEHCQDIYNAIKRNNVLLAVGHVLRYSPHNLALKKMLDDGAVGDIININHTEPVGWYHFAHSFVRGNWHKEETTTFALMAKCCHDIDLLMWFLGSEGLQAVSSFGSLSYFKRQNKPAEAKDALRCTDCAYERKCPYSAKRMYLDPLVAGEKTWKIDTLTDVEDADHVLAALEKGPYGQCVYECDNDVCDNQVVSLNFGNKTATMTMISTSKEMCERKICIYGSTGEIMTDSTTIEHFDYLTQKTTRIVPPSDPESNHGGGDRGLATAFAEAVRNVLEGKQVDSCQRQYICCTPEEMLASHRAVFFAEQARKENRVVNLKTPSTA